MEFVPFKPVAQPITFIEKPNNFVTSYNGGTNAGTLKDQALLRSKPKALKVCTKTKYAFIEKYNLTEIRSDLVKPDGSHTNMSYYYDRKSGTIFEIDNTTPIVFMKCDPETTKYLLRLNGLA
jgi:hypothetical protein